MSEFISIKKASGLMGCSVTWVNKLIASGVFMVYKKPYGRRLLKLQDILDYQTPQPVQEQTV